MSSRNTREWCELYVKEVIHQYNPKFRIEYKRKSLLFKLLKPIIKIINPTFFDNFTTTLFGVMWVPDRFFDRGIRHALKTTAHEGRHEYDRKRLPWLVFELMYSFPQNLFVPCLALACLISWWWLIPAVLFLAPLPAPFRYDLEMKGYAMENIWNTHVFQSNPWASDDHVVSALSSLRTYYATWPFKSWIYKDLEKPLDLENDKGFKDVLAFLKRHNLVRTSLLV